MLFPTMARVMWRLLVILCFLSAPLGAVGLRVVSYNVGAHLTNGGDPEGPYYFDYGLGDPASLDHTSVRDVLARIDADVVALQEIHSVDISGNPDDLDALAASLGLPNVYIPSTSGDIDPTFVVVFLSRYPFLEVDEVASPSGAKELTRNFPVVRIDVPGTTADPLIISAHLKSGTGSDDRFRRAVEMERLSKYFETEGITDDDLYILMGDFNPTGSPATFSSFPSGLPGAFALGADLGLPISYSADMTSYFSSVSPVILDPRQLDGSDATFQSGSTLDLMMLSPAITAQTFAMEIYNSALDLSNSSGLPKAGLPLAASVSLDASDHYAVFADLELVETPPYAFAASGDSVSENFDGFSGLRDPIRWSSDGAQWLGSDDGSSALIGGRAYASSNEAAVGFLLGGGNQSIEAKFANESTQLLTILDVSYQAEQWRAALSGSADRIEVELVIDGVVTSLAPLSFDAKTDLPDGLAANFEVKQTRVSGLSIAPGAEFFLRFNFLQGPGSGALQEDVFVNEFHYDNDGSDVGEFVEIVVGPDYSGELSDVVLQFYNGSSGNVDGAGHGLDTFTLGATTSSGHQIYSKYVPGIQNGAPDGFALVVDGAVSEFLSYEGSFTATAGPANGLTSVDVGVGQSTTNPEGTDAIARTGSGGVSDDFIWEEQLGVPHSPGTPNAGQAFILPRLPPQGLAIDDLLVTFVPDHDADGLADDEDPDDDNDGQSDEFELTFGSDPLDGNSVFEPIFTEQSGGYELSFPAADGVLYIIQWCDDLESWETHSTHLGAGAPISIPLPSSETRAFFRVKVE